MNSIFDIIGPVMIGPSSSHTAGAARLGKMARCIFRSTPKKVDLTLYGSFAKTYKGHGTDRALIGGLLGYKEDDTNIRIAHDLAEKEGMEYTFIESPLDVGHPNVVRFDMYDDHNRHMTVIGRSLGGGQIMITEVDGNDMSITGDEFTLVVFHEDRPGAISLISQALSESDINIATMRVFRKGKHKDTIADIIRLAEENNISFGDVVLRYELENYDRNEEAVIREIEHRLDIFEMSIQDGIAYTDKTASGMSGGQAAQLDGQSPRFMSEIAYKAMTYAIAVNEANAKMFRIVACPTAGSCGVMPGAVKAVADHYQLDKSTVVKGFLAASGIGNVVANRACVAGAVGGCQAEIGTAACMAAGAIVEMMGGTPRQVGHAIALCMKNLLGLACDPVAGLVEVPCVKRNGFYAVHAITASEMALMNIESQIPPDEVIEAMNNIGRAMPAALRETSDGGLAVTPTGTAIAERVQSL